MAIFNSYVSLPEGGWFLLPKVIKICFSSGLQQLPTTAQCRRDSAAEHGRQRSPWQPAREGSRTHLEPTWIKFLHFCQSWVVKICKNHPQIVTALLDLPSDLPHWDGFCAIAQIGSCWTQHLFRKKSIQERAGHLWVLCQNLQYISLRASPRICVQI